MLKANLPFYIGLWLWISIYLLCCSTRKRSGRRL